MKKEDVLGTFVYILLLGLAAIFVFVVLVPRRGPSGLGDAYIGVNLAAVLIGIIFNAILFEVAHVIGALIGGYKIIYVSILGLTLKEENKKWKLCFSDFKGLSGETRIVPKKEGCKPYPFLLAGTVAFIIELIGILSFFFAVKDEPGNIGNIAYALLDVLGVGIMIFIYNIIPAKLDCVTDGYNLALFANPKNREAFNELLRVNYELSQGNDVEIRLFDEITDFTAGLNMSKVELLYEEDKFDEAEPILDKIIEQKKTISTDVYLKAKSEKVFINFMKLPIEDIPNYYDKEIGISERRDIAHNRSTSSIRAYLLMSGLGDKSRSECVVCIERANKAFRKLNGKKKNIETTMFNLALKKICDIHPKWGLDKHIIKRN